jgi:hypothetical protein
MDKVTFDGLEKLPVDLRGSAYYVDQRLRFWDSFFEKAILWVEDYHIVIAVRYYDIHGDFRILNYALSFTELRYVVDTHFLDMFLQRFIYDKFLPELRNEHGGRQSFPALSNTSQECK